jgi:hypothetical protein
MKKSVLFFAAAMMASQAMAQSGVHLGTPGYAGTGCQAGTASAVLSPDATSLSILFSDYVTQAGGATGKMIDRRNCSIAIPVFVPQGFSVSILAIDYRGFNALPAGGSATLTASYFFAGGQGPTLSKRFVGPLNTDYTFTNNLIASALVWSACGAQAILRANTSIVTQTNQRMEDAMSTVDSADVQATMIYHLQWRRCF